MTDKVPDIKPIKQKEYLFKQSKYKQLWNKPTLEASIRDVNKQFNINVKLI
jgi:hypothetical protein